MFKHATIIPLIGGEVLGAEDAFGRPPEYILSYEAFRENENHLLDYYEWQGKDVPYHVIDGEDFRKPDKQVDAVSSVCPCAGLSGYHDKAGPDNQNNQWLPKATEYVLEEVKPLVYWGENAPALATNSGKWMRDKLREIGEKNGYRMSTYSTRSLLHGSPQIRNRTFFFFWNKSHFDGIPSLKWFSKEAPSIRDVIMNAEGNSLREPINPSIPSKDDPYYRYILEEVWDRPISHAEYSHVLANDPTYKRMTVEELALTRHGVTYDDLEKKFIEWGLDREVAKVRRKRDKIASGGGVMQRGTQIPVKTIGAFVVHVPLTLTHPIEDRYISYREALTIMGMPRDFDMRDPDKNFNHICQNVPVMTARDMAIEVRCAIAKQRYEVRGPSYLRQSNVNRRVETED